MFIMAKSDDFMKSKPDRVIFSSQDRERVLFSVKQWFAQEKLPTRLYKKRIFGSLAKKYFGEYVAPVNGKKFSDVDILLIVDDDFTPLPHWKIQFDYIPDLWVVYDAEVILVDLGTRKIEVELQFIVIKKSFSEKKETITDAEEWGIPLSKETQNTFIEL